MTYTQAFVRGGTVQTSDGTPVPGAPLVQNGNVLGYTDAQGNYELSASGQVTVYSSFADGPTTGTIGDTITMEPAQYDNVHDTMNVHYWQVDETDSNGDPTGWDVFGAPGARLDFEVVEGPQAGKTWTRYADKDLNGNYTSVARFQAPPTGVLKVTSTYNGATEQHFIDLKPGGRLMGIRLGNPKDFTSFEDSRKDLNATQVVEPGDRSGKVVSGTITNQAGTPVSNATVEVVSVEQQAIEDQLNETLSGTVTQDDIQQRVDELVGDSIPDIPSAFDAQQSDGFALTGANAKPSEFDGEYPLVYTRSDISANSGFSYFDTAQLSEPAWRDIDANQQVMLTAVDPTNGRDSGFLSGEYSSQVFGTFQNNGEVVVEPLVGEDATSRTTVSLDQRQGGGLGDPSALNYGTVALSDGFYRVSVVDSDISYVIKVGNPIQILSEEIRADVRDSVEDSIDNTEQRLTDAAQQAKNAFDSGAFQRVTSSTDSNGEFSVVLDERTETVIVQGYKYPSEDTFAFNRTQTGLQNAVSGEDAPAVYFPTRPRRTSVPAENLDITMTEFSTNPFGNATAYQDQFEEALAELKNETFSDLPQALQEGLDGTSREKLEQIATQFEGLRNNNEQLMELYRENLDQQVDAEAVAEELDLDQLSNDELKSQVQAMQQSLTEMQSTIEVLQESGETVQEEGQNLLSRTWSIGETGLLGDALASDALSVRITPSNGGETEVLSADSEYLSINDGPTGTTVALEDYPLGDMDVAQVQLDVATAAGLGTSTSTVTNPAFTATIPELDSLSFSTLSPGPSELVTGEVVPADRTAFGGLESVTITKPDGSTITPTLDGREFEFQTSGAGAYRIETTFSNSAGNQFTEVQYLDATDSDEQNVPRVRTVSGPTGTYTLTGGIDSARVDSEAGAETTITAVIGENAEIPGSLHVYTSGLELAPSADVTVAVVRAPDERRVNVVLHTPAPGDGALFRVNGAPIEAGAENSLATLDVRADGTTADTLTNANGVVTLSTTSNPSWWESIQWRVSNWSQSIPFLQIGGLSLAGLVPLSLSRRRNGGESA